jgi:hypothetical protein
VAAVLRLALRVCDYEWQIRRVSCSWPNTYSARALMVHLCMELLLSLAAAVVERKRKRNHKATYFRVRELPSIKRTDTRVCTDATRMLRACACAVI